MTVETIDTMQTQQIEDLQDDIEDLAAKVNLAVTDVNQITTKLNTVITDIENLVSETKGAIKRGPFGGALKKDIFVSEGYLVYEQYHALNNDFSMARYFIDEKKFEELKGFKVSPGDVIISCSGVNLGKLAIIPKNAKEGIINQALLKITLNSNIMSNLLFTFIFTNKNFKGKFFGNHRGSGVPNFPPMAVFKKFNFICPPIKLQNQFAQHIEKIEQQKQLA